MKGALIYFNVETIKRLQFTAVISTTRLDLESELATLRILDDNPQKPVVRMANLCVVSSHAVSGALFGTQLKKSFIYLTMFLLFIII